MNKNAIKKFAMAARSKLIDQVAKRANYYGISKDKIEAVQSEARDGLVIAGRVYPAKIKAQREHIVQRVNLLGYANFIEEIAYTWFNRFIALRFMEVNDCLPTGVRVLSSILPDKVEPDILAQAHTVDLPLDKARIFEYQDKNDSDGLYKYLLMAQCNALHAMLPFLFEKISDSSELLLPDNLLYSESVIRTLVTEIPEEDWREVEILGWLYQFYISEEKDRIIMSKKRYTKQEIAPATQLFTPKWIVQYMVDNTLGQIWLEAHPESNLKQYLEFLIEPAEKEKIPLRKIASPEEIKVFDPCMGSGHILLYAFDVLYQIYKEQGFNEPEIPGLILSKNLYGLDIDARAAQLANFSLMMKARSKYTRFFRKAILPNVMALQNIPGSAKFENATTFGSLIKVTPADVEAMSAPERSAGGYQMELPLAGEISLELKIAHKRQAEMLAAQYDCVITNPPYLNGKYMEAELKAFVEKEYKDTKSDLFAAFMQVVISKANKNGMIGLVTPYVWMFISSYEDLRKYLLEHTDINNLIQLEYNAFEPACVPVCTFTLRKAKLPKNGDYIRLSDFRGSENQPIKALEAIKNPNCGWFYWASSQDFGKIPGSPIAYWVSDQVRNIWKNASTLSKIAEVKHGLSTGNNDAVVRFWAEVSFKDLGLNISSSNIAANSGFKWFPYNKGGDFRKWYGNYEYILRYDRFGHQLMLSFSGHRHDGKTHYFQEGITWTFISSSKFAARYTPPGFIFDVSGSSLFVCNTKRILAFLCTKLCYDILCAMNPTLNFQVGNIRALPINETGIEKNATTIDDLSTKLITTSQQDWDSRETSWDFQQNELLKHKSSALMADAYQNYCLHWQQQFWQLHRNEEELNRIFIEIYGLQDEMTPDVDPKDITILPDEIEIVAMDGGGGGDITTGRGDIHGVVETHCNASLRGVHDIRNVHDAHDVRNVHDVHDIRNAHDVQNVHDIRNVHDVHNVRNVHDVHDVRNVHDVNDVQNANDVQNVNDVQHAPRDCNETMMGYGTIHAGAHGKRLQFKPDVIVKQFISYAVGCMMGRYSLDVNGLAYAGGEFDPAKYVTFKADDDAILPILDDDYFEDDIVSRFLAFVKVTFGEEKYAENLEFIATALGKTAKETASERIRKYFLNDFYKEHVQRYKKRPIYWLFTSGKGKAFNVLVYLHRYHPGLVAKIRTDYLHELQGKLELAERRLLDGAEQRQDPKARLQAQKQLTTLAKKKEELRQYDEKLRHAADQQIPLDLDDGVVVNYAKFRGLVGEI